MRAVGAQGEEQTVLPLAVSRGFLWREMLEVRLLNSGLLIKGVVDDTDCLK